MQRCLTCKERVHVHIYLSIELLKNINRNIICNWNFIPLSQLYQNELRLIISFIFHFYIIFFNSCEMCCIDVRVCLVKKLNWKTRMEFILIISGYGHSGIVDFPREADEAWKRLWRGYLRLPGVALRITGPASGCSLPTLSDYITGHRWTLVLPVHELHPNMHLWCPMMTHSDMCSSISVSYNLWSRSLSASEFLFRRNLSFLPHCTKRPQRVQSSVARPR